MECGGSSTADCPASAMRMILDDPGPEIGAKDGTLPIRNTVVQKTKYHSEHRASHGFVLCCAEISLCGTACADRTAARKLRRYRQSRGRVWPGTEPADRRDRSREIDPHRRFGAAPGGKSLERRNPCGSRAGRRGRRVRGGRPSREGFGEDP